MQIESLRMQNFKMFEDKEITFYPQTRISAGNEKGKTTLADAFSWLFFGKSSDGNSDDNFVKPIIDGEVQTQLRGTKVDPTLAPQVTAVVDGVEYSRKLIEKWTRHRGAEQKNFTGNKTEYAIDGVGATQKVFKEAIANVFGKEEDFKLLTNPWVIPNMKWGDMRSLVIGETTDIEPLTNELDGLKKKRTEQVRLTEDLPIRIEEQTQSLTDAAPFVEEDYQAAIKKREELNNEIISAENDGGKTAYREQVNALKTEADTSKLNYLTAVREADCARREKVQGIEERLRELSDKRRNAYDSAMDSHRGTVQRAETYISQLVIDTDRLQVDLNDSIAKLTNLKEIYHKTNAIDPNAVEGVCSACGSILPEEKVEQSRKAVNADKSAKLEQNIASGKAEKKRNSELMQTIGEKNLEIKATKKTLAELLGNTPTMEPAGEEETNLHVQVSGLREATSEAQCADLKQKMADDAAAYEKAAINPPTGETETGIDMSPKIEERDALNTVIEEMLGARAITEKQEQTHTRIKNLRDELKTASKELTDTEKAIFECEKKIKIAVKAAESALNARFSITTWKLFHEQTNGEVKPTCVPMVNGIPYRNLNRAMQLNCGLDIITTLMKEKGVSYTVWTDNAECANEITKTGGQMINLYVSLDDELVVKDVTNG